MTPPRTLRQETPDAGVCASHDIMVKMFERAMEGLSQQIEKLAEAVTAQSRSNGDALSKVLSNQADRRELCGQQNARLDNLEKRADARDEASETVHKEMWSAINKLRYYVYMAVGIGAVGQVLGGVLFKMFFDHLTAGK